MSELITLANGASINPDFVISVRPGATTNTVIVRSVGFGVAFEEDVLTVPSGKSKATYVAEVTKLINSKKKFLGLF